MSSFQVFRIHNDAASNAKEDIRTLACAAKSQKTLQDQISPSTPVFRTPLQKLPQTCAFTDAEALPPPSKCPYLFDGRINPPTLLSNSPGLPQSSPLHRLSTSFAKPVRKRGRPRKAMTASSKQALVSNAPEARGGT